MRAAARKECRSSDAASMPPACIWAANPRASQQLAQTKHASPLDQPGSSDLGKSIGLPSGLCAQGADAAVNGGLQQYCVDGLSVLILDQVLFMINCKGHNPLPPPTQRQLCPLGRTAGRRTGWP